MQINSGLLNKAVLQRNNKGICDLEFAGTCESTGRVALLTEKSEHNSKPKNIMCSGSAARGKFTGTLKGLPAGGPYNLKIGIIDKDGKVLESTEVKDILVGDVWILAGQSNMQGYGSLADAPRPNPAVRAFFMNDEWDTSEEPTHNLSDAMDPVHGGRRDGRRTKPNNTPVGASPGTAFGIAMFERTGVPQGLIPCAHGGTSMEQWSPSLKSKGGHSLYGAMFRRFIKNGSKVAGIAWYQGCSETDSQERARVYTRKMKAFVRAIRRDFQSPDLPIVVVQIGRLISKRLPDTWLSVQDQQRKFQQTIPNCFVVPAVDLDLDDIVHISGASQVVLGKRIAQAMAVLKGIKNSGKPPIVLKEIKCIQNAIGNESKIAIVFDNVSGKLSSSGRANGFSLGTPEPTPSITHTEAKNNMVIIRSVLPANTVSGMFVSHGAGIDPYVNVFDSDNRPLPAFGPIPVGKPLIDTSFVESLQVSKALPLKGDIANVSYPKSKKVLNFEKTDSLPNTHFFNLSKGKFNSDSELYAFFLCQLECSERMKVKIGVGYDGPVKVWINSKDVFCDPNGINPCSIDKALLPATLPKGKSEILIALSSNKGKAWGIKLRISRACSETINPFELENVKGPKILG